MGNCECNWINKVFFEREQSEKEKKYFNNIKEGLKESIVDITKTIKPIKDYKSLLELNSEEEFFEETEELYKKNRLRKSQRLVKNIQEEPNKKDIYSTWSDICYLINNSKCCRGLCFSFGFLFILIQYIGVQEGIIILNALFEEIIDEFRLIVEGTHKEYNFYQKIENASYRIIPEIDIGMFWSFIGIIILKKFGFIWSNIFQLLSLIGFILLFLLFEFHKGNQLLEKYTNIEFTVLIFAFIVLSITVGGSSMIPLKQFMNIYQAFYKKNYNIYTYINLSYQFELLSETISQKDDESVKKHAKYGNKNESNTIVQLFLFYNFSTSSFALIVLINRMIFTSLKKITSKWMLKSILIVYSSCYVLSLLFYLFFSFPLIRNEIEKQIKNQEINLNNKIKAVEHNNNKDNSQANLNNNIKPNESEVLGLKNEIFKNNKKKLVIKNQIKKGNEKINDNNYNDNEVNKNIIEINDNKNKDSIKVCTCIGYLYFQKKIGDKTACIFYDYDSCCSWFWKQLKKPEICIPFFVELAMQLNIIGFNPILSDYLLKKFSFTKTIKFFLVFLICVFHINIYTLLILPYLNFAKYGYDDKTNLIPKLICAFILIYLIGIYSLFIFIYSIVYIASKDTSGIHYENCIIASIIFFKNTDFYSLSFYDFLDDMDCLNTSVIITFERFLWIIIEVIIDSAETNWTILVSIQIGISFIILILFGLFICKFIIKLN